MSTLAADLLAQSKRLLSATTAEEVLDLTCREVQRLAGCDLVFGSVGSSANWATGVHRRFVGVEKSDVEAAQRSALFAVHRVVSRERVPVRLERTPDTAFVETLCGAGANPAILALPVIHSRGLLSGSIALCTRGPMGQDIDAALIEVAGLAALALENVQRIASARRDRERLSLLAEAAEEALWDWVPETGEFWWGGGVQTLIGDVVVQSRLSWKFEQIHPDDKQRVRGSFEQALASADAETWSEEYRQRRSDGSWIIVEDHAHILRDSAGRAQRVVGALRDVTQLRTLINREQAARAVAESASLAKDEFLAMLGHELRNPLSPIVSTLHVLRKRREPEVIDKGLAVIERQARHLTRLVDDLLDVARIAKGKVHLERERIDLAEVIDSALETADPLIQERRHTVEATLERNLFVDADRARMFQVISNLVANAAKYTPPGGRIFVDGHEADGFVQVTIADTGIGISPEMLPLVFDTFVQARQSIDRMRGGLGLGLAIVRNLAQLHGGTVDAHSEGEGRGSQFVLRLPAMNSQSLTSAAAPLASAEPSVGMRVLIVDDNRDAAQSLAEVLSVWGHSTQIVYEGAATVPAIESFDPDVVLLDLGLPMMDGYEVARQLRQRFGNARPRLVAVTGYGQDSDRAKSREAGFDTHLVKPVPFDQLRQALMNSTGPSH